MYIYIYIYVYVCVCVYIYIYIYIYSYTYTYILTNAARSLLSIEMCSCGNFCIAVGHFARGWVGHSPQREHYYKYINGVLYIYIYISISIYIYMLYIYIYICMCVYIYIYTRTHMSGRRLCSYLLNIITYNMIHFVCSVSFFKFIFLLFSKRSTRRTSNPVHNTSYYNTT